MGNVTQHESGSQAMGAAEHYEWMAHSLEGERLCANCDHDITFHMNYLGDPAPCDKEIADTRGRLVGLCGCTKFAEAAQ